MGLGTTKLPRATSYIRYSLLMRILAFPLWVDAIVKCASPMSLRYMFRDRQRICGGKKLDGAVVELDARCLSNGCELQPGGEP